MDKNEQNTDQVQPQEHISSYAEHFGTWIALCILTLMTVFISTFGADLKSLTVATAMFIASIKAFTVAMYFMHIKYEPKVYKVWIIIVMALFVFFLFMVSLDLYTR